MFIYHEYPVTNIFISPVSVRILVAFQIERVRLADNDPVKNWENHAGKHQLIGEYGMLVVDAVAVGIFVTRHAADGSQLFLSVERLWF